MPARPPDPSTATEADTPPQAALGPAVAPPARSAPEPADVRLHGWRHPAILSAAFLAMAAGFGQFGVTAALGDVAAGFGEAGAGQTIAEQIGLSLTTIGLGLAIIRFASLASLPLAALADRSGRRRVILGCSLGGLALTAAAGASPTFWWFVAIFALGRPLMSATNALAAVIAAEETPTADRAKAIALIAAAYGIGAGIVTLIRGFGGLGFRPLFFLALVPFALVALTSRRLEEPDRFARLRDAAAPDVAARPGRIPSGLRGRLLLLSGLGFAFAAVTGPANTLIFLYAEGVLKLSQTATAAVTLAAGLAGLAGLLAGRWAADRIGRLPTVITGHALVAVAMAITYGTGTAGAIGGYLTSLSAQAAFGTALGALGAELFPTQVRGTAAGWLNAAGVLGAGFGLLAFGRLVDAFGSFRPAAVALTLPVLLAALAYRLLPETRGQELEDALPTAMAR